MRAKKCLLCLLLLWLGGALGLARAAERNPIPGSGDARIGAGPIQLVMRPDAKPTVLFTTPCMQLNHLDGGVGPFASLREWLARRVLDSNRFLPVELQPVCM
ncbi:MAG: hypothetical protein NZ524_11210 [Thiobacillaceae bacterium]|nr:hypothetical protein [Thiobacillaceae bacterium]MCX7674167.1 hypothetical protein [Thiobacillaceae bacterium]MDW8322965.1 hypothetical protein [Burkholderiales bacterium]